MKFLGILAICAAVSAAGEPLAMDMEALFPPVPEATESITFRQMLKKAEENSFAIQKALVSEQSVKAMQERALGAFLPTASAALSYNGELQLLPVDKRQHRISGTAQLWLPLIDVNSWAGYRVTKGRLSAQKNSTELVKEQVSYQLAMAYLQAVSMRALLDLLRGEVEAIVQHRQIASWRISSGIGSASEELQAQMELISLRKEYAAARLSYIRQCENLGQLLGHDGPVAPAENRVVIKSPGEKTEHLQLTIARQSLDLAQKSLKASKFDLLPTLGSTWQLGAGWPLKPEGDNTFSLGAAITLNIPLFNWSTIANIHESRASMISARIALAEQEQQLLREERLAKENLAQLETESILYKEQADLAQETLTLDLADYQNGGGSALQIVQSRRAHQSAVVDELRSRYALDIARLTYLQAAGYRLEQVVE